MLTELSLRNRTILDGKLSIEIKKPFTELAKRAERAVGVTDENELNLKWWCVLAKARTHFGRFEE